MNDKTSPSVLRSKILGSFNRVRRLVFFVVVVVVVALVYYFAQGEASPPFRTVDVLSFTPPAGWETTQKAGSGPMTMSDVNQAKDISCQIKVYNSVQSSGNLAADFFSEWTAIIGGALPDVGDVSDEGARIVGVAQAVPTFQNNYVRLITYSAGAKVATVVVVTPNSEAYEVYRPKIDAFLASVTVNSAASGRPRIDAGQQAQEGRKEQGQATRTTVNPTPQSERAETSALQSSQDASPVAEANLILSRPPLGTPPASAKLVWVAEWKKSVRMSDLAGEWKNTWRDGGTYLQETIVFRGDGTFTSSFWARGAKTIDEENHGTYALSPGPMLKYAKGTANYSTHNILEFKQLPDGSSTMIMLNSVYPINEANRLYEDKFIRAAPEATPRAD